MCRGKFYSVLLTCDEYCKMLRDNPCMYVAHVCFYVCCSDSAGSVEMFVVYQGLLMVVGFISRCEVLCVGYLCSGCDGYCAFCLTCDACNCKYFYMGRMLVSSCRCCIFVSCVQFLIAAIFTNCSLLMPGGGFGGGSQPPLILEGGVECLSTPPHIERIFF